MNSRHLYTQLTTSNGMNTIERTRIIGLKDEYEKELKSLEEKKTTACKENQGFYFQYLMGEIVRTHKVIEDLEKLLDVKPLSVQTVLEELEKTDEEFSFEEIVYKIQEMGYEGDSRTLADQVMESKKLTYVRENILGEAMYLHNKVYQREYA